jgi:hypothetical protein
VFLARTLAEITAAKQALRDWLTEHPDEPGMADALEVLAHQEKLLPEQAALAGDGRPDGAAEGKGR